MDTIGKEFMEKTKYHHLDLSGQMKGMKEPSLELEYDTTKTLIHLPSPQEINVKDVPIKDAIESRVSVREYSKKSLQLIELSYLLWCTQGVKEVIPHSATLRTVPSAGARHCFETFLLVNNVDGLEPGLYRYIALEHVLIAMNEDTTLSDKITKACFNQMFIKTSAVTFMWTAVAYRMTWRYGERGYRYMHLDAGHICQNLYLSAESIACGVCAIGAFSDNDMNRLLNLDGIKQFVIYMATVGKNK